MSEKREINEMKEREEKKNEMKNFEERKKAFYQLSLIILQ